LENRPDPKTELTIYRCITELINNTLRHAEARRITFDLNQSGNQLLLTYTDDGKGFDPSSRKMTGMGINNLKNRVESSGGTFSMHSSSGSGIFVNINLPL
jgi:signal transduction histidine kinase